MTRRMLPALVTLLLMAAPAAVRADPPADEVQKRLEQLEKEMALTRKLLEALADLQDVKRRLGELERRVDGMDRPRPPRESPFGPETGTIRLQNRLSLPATILIDGVPQRLQPGETRDLPGQPAGPFTFEVLVDGFGALQPRAMRTLRPGTRYEIFTYLP